MKKINYLLILLISIFIIPTGVFAKGSKKINIYFFRGEGCPHCEEAEEFFDSIQSKYGKYYNIVDYEVWNDKDNADLMQKVADHLGQEVSGVPYIIIGKQTWNGYASSYDNDIKKAIKDEYNKSEADRFDVLKNMGVKVKSVDSEKKSTSDDIFTVILIVLIVGGATYGVIKLRNKA